MKPLGCLLKHIVEYNNALDITVSMQKSLSASIENIGKNEQVCY